MHYTCMSNCTIRSHYTLHYTYTSNHFLLKVHTSVVSPSSFCYKSSCTLGVVCMYMYVSMVVCMWLTDCSLCVSPFLPSFLSILLYCVPLNSSTLFLINFLTFSYSLSLSLFLSLALSPTLSLSSSLSRVHVHVHMLSYSVSHAYTIPSNIIHGCYVCL